MSPSRPRPLIVLEGALFVVFVFPLLARAVGGPIGQVLDLVAMVAVPVGIVGVLVFFLWSFGVNIPKAAKEFRGESTATSAKPEQGPPSTTTSTWTLTTSMGTGVQRVSSSSGVRSDQRLTADPTSALATERLLKRYGRRGPWALRDLTLAIPAGSITALVGPNGAGKSTVMRSWLGFERADSGRVLVNGIDPVTRRSDALRQIGYVPQASALYPALTIEDHLVLVSSYRPAFDKAWARERIRVLGLDGHRRLGTLSGGERAQVALAIALGLHAPVLLMDEPMASLDPLARREFIGTLVNGARSSGATVVLSSHIVTDIEEACDAVVVMSNGRLLFHDTIARARAEHVAMDPNEATPGDTVGTFAGPGGNPVALVRHPAPPGREATLEEIVLGYLGSAVDPKRAAAA